MSRARSLALLSAVVALSACYSWSKPQPQAQSIIETRPAQVRVTLSDGRRLIVKHPAIRGDSLLGDVVVEGSENSPSARAIPFSDVRSVSTPRFSAVWTALTVGAVGVVLYVINWDRFLPHVP
jgi:hypothetical protein